MTRSLCIDNSSNNNKDKDKALMYHSLNQHITDTARNALL